MLTELHIENLGVIERLELILGDGLTVVTGETGAGKTMLVEAIELLVGGRADTTVVRHGTDEARVDGRFITADGDELVLSRVIARNGRSRAYVNGRLATVASLAEATDRAGRPPRPARPSEPAVDRDAAGRTRPVRPSRPRTAAGCPGPTHRDRRRTRGARRRRAGAGAGDRPAAVPARRTRPAPMSSMPTRTRGSTPRRRCSAMRSGSAKRASRPWPRSPTTVAHATRWPPPSVRSTDGRRTTRSSSGCTPH